MSRAQICELSNGPTLKRKGRLVGDWAEQAKSLVMKDSVPEGLIVDLTEVAHVYSVGDQIRKWLVSIGAKFIAKGICAAGTYGRSCHFAVRYTLTFATRVKLRAERFEVYAFG